MNNRNHRVEVQTLGLAKIFGSGPQSIELFKDLDLLIRGESATDMRFDITGTKLALDRVRVQGPAAATGGRRGPLAQAHAA